MVLFDLSGGAFDALLSHKTHSNFKLDLDALADSLGGMENLPDIDLSEAFAGLDLSISPDALQAFVQKVSKGYKNYIIGNGILNFKKVELFRLPEVGAVPAAAGRIHAGSGGHPRPFHGPADRGRFRRAEDGTGRLPSDQVRPTRSRRRFSAALESSIQSAMGPLMQSFQQNLQTMLEKNLAQLGSQMENAIEDRHQDVPECHPAQHEHRRPHGADGIHAALFRIQL